MSGDALRVMAVIVALLALKTGLLGYGSLVKPMAWPTGETRRSLDNLVETLSSRDLNKEAREALTAGYYEGLLNEGSRISGMNQLLADSRVADARDNLQPDRRQIKDFLLYELIPNSDIADYRDERARYRLKTNSAGFSDGEYSLEKPEGVRRIALMGDSITRGQGAPFGGNFESLLEQQLNESNQGAWPKIEILNFSVGSYNMTQQLDIASTRARAYRPDAYVYGLSPLSVYRRWGRHISMLMSEGIDLKYEYLKSLVKKADLRADDPVGVFDAKIAKFRLDTIRWTLSEMKALASREQASILILLVPDVARSPKVSEDFLGVPEILRDLDIPYVPLVDAFDEATDLGPLMVAENDKHPNAEGHRLLHRLLIERLRADPEKMAVFVGQQKR
jgi:lysophospholipase L1-like esterase